MRRSNLWILLWIVIALLSGFFYIWKYAVTIDIPPQKSTQAYGEVRLSATSEQDILLDVATEKRKIRKVICGSQVFDFGKEALKWYETPTQRIALHLSSPIVCRVYTNAHYPCKLRAQRVYTHADMLFFLLTFGTIAAWLLYQIFFWVLGFIGNHVSIPKPKREGFRLTQREKTVLYGILAIGILIRLLYFNAHGVYLFQHDWQGHIAYIEYMASHWHIPLPTKSLEFPQQPLYYSIAALIYKTALLLGNGRSDALMAVGGFSLFCSILFLLFTYRVLSVLQSPFFVRLTTLLFVSLTPSIVYLSARINNDALVMVLGAVSLYYIVRYYYSVKRRDFYVALLSVSALFLTKVSAFPFEVLLLSILVLHVLAKRKEEVKQHVVLYIGTGIVLLGWTLYRVYMPLDSSVFHLVNSSAHFPGQQIVSAGAEYFFSFHPQALFAQGYAHVFGDDAVRFSFPTYQLGTMLTGEFDYSSYGEHHVFFIFISRLMIALAMLLPIALVSYLFYLWESPLLEKLFFLTVIVNLLLIIRFILNYPVVCNSDFRYFVAVFPLWGMIFARGLFHILTHMKSLKYVLYLWLFLFGISEFLFLLYIIVK